MTRKVSSHIRRSGEASRSGHSHASDEYAGNIQKARQTLADCVRGLDMLSSSTEDEFILVGENLGDFSGRSRGKSSSSKGVALNVEDIVTLIQFHDITRQQFQRSSRACRAMIDKLTSADKGKCLSAREDRARSALAEDLLRFCIDQSRIIAETREKFVSAVGSLVQKLEAIALEVRRKAGKKLAAEIEISFKGICIDKFAGAVADEVLSNLNDICANIGQLVSPDVLERIKTASGQSAFPPENGRGCSHKAISSKTVDGLGDNVELF